MNVCSSVHRTWWQGEICSVAWVQAVRKTGCELVAWLSTETGRGRGGAAGQETPDLSQLFLHCLHSSGLVTRPAY